MDLSAGSLGLKTMFLTPLAPQNTGKQQRDVASDATYLFVYVLLMTTL